MFRWINRRLTRDFTKVPLLWVDFNYKKYQEKGARGSCVAKIHPSLANDKHVEDTLRHLVDYIRETHDMDDLI